MVNSTPDSSSSSSAYTPEPSSPLFLLSSDVPGVSLAAVPFSGTNFGGWRRSMIVSLSARNKIGFIDGSCTKPAVDSPQYRQWDRYGTVNGTKVFEIKRELASTYQGTLDIASYFNKLKKLWDELGVMCTSHANSCVCAAKEGLQKEKEEDRVHQFLMGLNEVYVGVRSNILIMQPLSSLDTVYNILLQDEKQRQVVPNAQLNPESDSFNANSNINRFPSQLSSTKQYTQRVNFDSSNQRSNDTLSCKYCKKPGHTIEKCYKLHGFPPNFKFTKGKKFGTAASAEGQTSEPSAMYPPTDQSSMIPGLTKEKYSQLMQLLSQSILGDSGSQPVLMGSANFASSTSSSPMCLNGSSTVRMLTSVAGRVWIVDSEANDHMTSNKKLLFNITPLPVPYLVSLPNGYKVKAHSMKKLLELGRMDQGLYKFHLNHSAPPTISSPNNSVLQNAKFSLHGNVQNVNHSSVPDLPCATIQNVQTENSCHVSTLPSCTVPNNVNKNDVLWHYRLGHVPFVQMKHIPSISNDLSTKQSFICPSNMDTSFTLQELCFTLLKAFVAMVKTQFHLSVQKVRSDNALELGSSNTAIQFFSDNGIIHQTACPHTPQQNGVVERKHRHLLETSRALLFQSNLPTKFWGDWVLIATYLINRFPSKVLSNKTPFELLYGAAPSYSHLKPFGCLCYASVPKCHRDKFQPKASPCVFIGYPFAKKGYKLYNLTTKSVLYSRDVIFHECVFPYTLPSSASSYLPPSMPIAYDSNADAVTASSIPPDLPLPPSPIRDTPPDAPNSVHNPDVPTPIHSTVPVESVVLPGPAVRKSSRTHQLPSHLKDYVVQLPSASCSSSSLMSTTVEPHSYTHAAAIPAWQEAMRKEFEALDANQTWKIVELPAGKKPIGCKWVHKIKYISDGSVER
ncbi:PREDICTED: uncharacterized protein LOC109209461 [Nicotiana attenuata]|uniref:uncharacterized protein LOC109209461 n=1 Tax=Nicotiana attenuata TaxID=49451 RepID=UPI000904A281|nr:PREDICTED: uncharacterized protein LOC109209461 [Nicotiana attenuata]